MFLLRLRADDHDAAAAPDGAERCGGVAAQMTAEGRIFACNRRSRGMGLEEDEERSNRRSLGWLSAYLPVIAAVTP